MLCSSNHRIACYGVFAGLWNIEFKVVRERGVLVMVDPDHIVAGRYLGCEYFQHNPTWDSEDSTWKSQLVVEILRSHAIVPGSIVDIGCGAGVVLGQLLRTFPDADMHGYDIAPDVQRFWSDSALKRVQFHLGDFLESGDRIHDVALILDVIEHLENPFRFLATVRHRANWFVFHFPLDLSASSVLREKPLLHVRNKVGHVHYFTKGLAIELLLSCGYHIIDWRYTSAALSGPGRRWKSMLASVPRRIVYAISKDWGVRLLGGETLIVLARPRPQS